MGQLFYVIGASGVGKDTLLSYAREKIDGQFPIIFAHRYITRPANARGENHVSVTTKEFRLRKAQGLFAMHWESHGNFYGIGSEIDIWLARDCSVVLNGSREYLPEARRLYPRIVTVLIEASPANIASRLSERKRETEDEIRERISRSKELNTTLAGNVFRIQNDGPIEAAGEEMLGVLKSGMLVG